MLSPRKLSRDYGYYIGIDVSLTETGVAVLAGGDTTTKNLFVVKTGTENSDWQRQRNIIAEVCKIVSEFSGVSIAVGIEDYAMGAPANGRSGKMFTRAEVVGMLKMALAWHMGCDLYMVPPTSLKKFVTGSGRASKDEVVAAVFRRWGQYIENDNIGDAYGLCQYVKSASTGKGSDMSWSYLPRRVFANLLPCEYNIAGT